MAAWLALARLLLVERFESTHDLAGDWYNHAQYLEQRREMLQWYGEYVDGLAARGIAVNIRKKA